VDLPQETMKLQHKGETIQLKMERIEARILICEEIIDLRKEKKQGSQILIAQLFYTHGEEAIASKGISEFRSLIIRLDPLLQSELKKYEQLFEEPTSLPPHRSIDHQIILKPDSKPINLRPYRFSYYQKLEIEKIIQELLDHGYIHQVPVLILLQFFW
jgi:hypothetical protein